MQNTRGEQMLSASIPNSDVARHSALCLRANCKRSTVSLARTYPTGNSRMHAMRQLPVVPICRMGSRLRRRANQNHLLAHPASMKRGVRASSRHVRRGCDGRGWHVRRTCPARTAKSYGPGLPTLRLRLRDHLADDGGKKARSPGRVRRKPLKPSRRECRLIRLNLW